jgi:hypothetical protein
MPMTAPKMGNSILVAIFHAQYSPEVTLTNGDDFTNKTSSWRYESFTKTNIKTYKEKILPMNGEPSPLVGPLWLHRFTPFAISNSVQPLSNADTVRNLVAASQIYEIENQLRRMESFPRSRAIPARKCP